MRKQIAAVVTALLLAACATPSQMSADAEVRRLCAIDGGIKVYETVRLPTDRFDRNDSISIPDKAHVKPTDDYYYEWNVQHYREGNPSLRRDHFKVIRQSDGKVLGEDVSYARRGGDIQGPWHDSSFRCPATEKHLSLESLIFLKEDR